MLAWISFRTNSRVTSRTRHLLAHVPVFYMVCMCGLWLWVGNCNFALLCEFQSWWRHQMENISAVLTICAGNSPVAGEFPAKRPVTRSFDVFFDLRLNKRLSKQSWGWWFETISHPFWRHCNVMPYTCILMASRRFPSSSNNTITHWHLVDLDRILDKYISSKF